MAEATIWNLAGHPSIDFRHMLTVVVPHEPCCMVFVRAGELFHGVLGKVGACPDARRSRPRALGRAEMVSRYFSLVETPAR